MHLQKFSEQGYLEPGTRHALADQGHVGESRGVASVSVSVSVDEFDLPAALSRAHILGTQAMSSQVARTPSYIEANPHFTRRVR